jgi:hypothetical protein
MIRTIVYERPRRPEGGLEAVESTKDEPTDGYAAQLLKYVPAEILAFFIPAAAAAKGNSKLSWVVFVAGLAATVGYLRFHAEPLPAEQRPPLHFYALAAAAFVFWAMGSSDTVRALFQVSDTTTEVLLGIAVLLLPLADWLLGKLFRTAPEKREPAPKV